MDRGRASEGLGRYRDVDEVREVWRGEAVDGFGGVEQDFVLDEVCDGGPVELLQDGVM